MYMSKGRIHSGITTKILLFFYAYANTYAAAEQQKKTCNHNVQAGD